MAANYSNSTRRSPTCYTNPSRYRRRETREANVITQPTTHTSHELYDHTYSREAITIACSSSAPAAFIELLYAVFYNRHVRCRE